MVADKKLNSEQIQSLYAFTRQHFVEWYDLQTELVDHLANAIEAQWQQHPNKAFDEALQVEFKKFGVFGFMDVVEKRQAALSAKYRKIVWKHFKNFFQLPEILGTLSASGILYLVLKWSIYSEIIFIGLLVIILIAVFLELYFNQRKLKQNQKETDKKWLFEDILMGYGQGFAILNLPLQTVLHFRADFNNDYVLLGVSFFIVALSLFQYVILVIIPNKAEEYLIETYPEYKLS